MMACPATLEAEELRESILHRVRLTVAMVPVAVGTVALVNPDFLEKRVAMEGMADGFISLSWGNPSSKITSSSLPRGARQAPAVGAAVVDQAALAASEARAEDGVRAGGQRATKVHLAQTVLRGKLVVRVPKDD